MSGDDVKTKAERTVKFLQKLSKEYYRRTTLLLPKDLDYREFAAQLWGSTTYVRHLAFRSASDAVNYVAERGPRHFYYSSARYEQPGAPDMDAKGWISADVIFDIDADHIPYCENYTITVEDKDLDVKANFTDPVCIREAGLQALLLYDVLVHELGFDRSRVRVEFSGNRGFHVIVETGFNDEWGKADASVRRELVNYIKAIDLLDETLNPKPPVTRRRKPLPLEPSPSDPGLRGRFARFKAIVSKLKRVEGDEQVREYLSLAVDEQVTVDVKRLIRVTYSIHGKTMLPVLPVNPERAPYFELTTDISPFRDLDRIRVQALVDTPPLSILGHRLRLRKGTRMKLEAPVALVLMAKGVAVLS